MGKFALGFFLAVHGLIHLGYLTPNTDPKYPFNLGNSWIITHIGLNEPSVRFIGHVLIAVTVIGFACAGLAATGIIIPQNWWLPITIVASITSLLVLLLFWHTWLILGVAIDVVLLVALLWLGWQPFGAT
jgi:hypothetical protein